MIQRSIFVLPSVLKLITVLFLLPFIGCLFEDVKNKDTCVENYCKIYFQQKCVQITSNGGISRRKSPGNTKENGVRWVGIFFISECVSKPKTELSFISSAFLDAIPRVTYLSLLWHPAGMTIMMSSLPKGISLCILYYLYQCLIAMCVSLGKVTTGSKYLNIMDTNVSSLPSLFWWS